MLILVQTQSGNRFIGEVQQPAVLDDGTPVQAMPRAGEAFILLYPLGYIEQPNQQGHVNIGLPPPILAGPVKEMSVIATFVIPLEGSGLAQLRAAYEEATKAVRAAITGIIPASAGTVPNLRTVK